MGVGKHDQLLFLKIHEKIINWQRQKRKRIKANSRHGSSVFLSTEGRGGGGGDPSKNEIYDNYIFLFYQKRKWLLLRPLPLTAPPADPARGVHSLARQGPFPYARQRLRRPI